MDKQAGPFEPLLTQTDWNAEWKRLQSARHRADDATVWDKKAETFPVKHGSQEGYAQRFLDLAAIRPGETVLDMGCGTGTLATPLALRGCRVIACDFSGGMLAKMIEDQASLGVTGVETHQMSWADDWHNFGIGPKSVDVAIASRSIATDDLQDALLSLDAVARRRCCLTLPCGSSPRVDDRLIQAVGLAKRSARDFLYAFNILAANGIYPEVSYIPTTRLDFFDSPECALREFTRIVTEAVAHTATAEQVASIPDRLRPWLDENLIRDERGYHLSGQQRVTWAFLAWEPRTPSE